METSPPHHHRSSAVSLDLISIGKSLSGDARGVERLPYQQTGSRMWKSGCPKSAESVLRHISLSIWINVSAGHRNISLIVFVGPDCRHSGKCRRRILWRMRTDKRKQCCHYDISCCSLQTIYNTERIASGHRTLEIYNLGLYLYSQRVQQRKKKNMKKN